MLYIVHQSARGENSNFAWIIYLQQYDQWQSFLADVFKMGRTVVCCSLPYTDANT